MPPTCQVLEVTPLARELIRLFGQDNEVEVLFLDDPYYPTPAEFLLALLRLFGRVFRRLRGTPAVAARD